MAFERTNSAISMEFSRKIGSRLNFIQGGSRLTNWPKANEKF